MRRFVKAAFVLLSMTTTLAFADNTNQPNNNQTNNKVATSNTTKVAVSSEERAKIEEVVHQYLLQKPEVIIESIQNFQKKQYEQAEQTVKQTQQSAPQYTQALFHQPNDPISGNPKGKVTVVEFFDYQCPHCADMLPTMEAVLKANPNLRVVHKDWPIRGPVSDFAARAAIAANKQGKYREFSHALLKTKPPLDQNKILAVAKATGLNMTQLQKDMDDPTTLDQIKATTKLAQDLKLFGTPAFFFAPTEAANSAQVIYIPGQLNQAQMQEIIGKVSK